MSEYIEAEVEAGATLALALEAVRRQSDYWRKYKKLKEEIRDFEQRAKARAEKRQASPVLIHSGSDMPGFPGVRTIQLGIKRQKTEFESLENGFNSEFLDFLLTGNLIAFGKVGGFSEPYKLIQPEYWQSMDIVDFDKSVIREKTQAKAEWLAVRVFAKGEAPQPVWSRSIYSESEKTIPGESSVPDPNEPVPIPLLPKIVGKSAKTAVENVARAYPDRFEWALDQPKFATIFSKEVAGPTGFGFEACRTKIRINESRLRILIKKAKSDN